MALQMVAKKDVAFEVKMADDSLPGAAMRRPKQNRRMNVNEYRFNVALNGKHLFRTDWIDDGLKADEVSAALAAAFKSAAGYSIDRYSRSKSMTSKKVEN